MDLDRRWRATAEATIRNEGVVAYRSEGAT